MTDESDAADQRQPQTQPQPRPPTTASRPTLDTAVRRRRADQAFFIRLSQAIGQNQRALERLGQ